MKKNQLDKQSITFDEFREVIDKLISEKKIDKLKLQENYFEICNNYWIVSKNIANNGQFNSELTPNALSTYELAIKNNYAISIPLQILNDGNIVCFSHKNISKVLNDKDGYLNTLNLDQVKEFNLNDKEEKIPTLDETLNFIAGRTPIILEIINQGMIGKFEDKVLQAISKYIVTYNAFNNIAIMSINPYTLQYCFQQYPYITRILKSGKFNEKLYGSLSTKKLKKLKYYKITHADFICYPYELLPCAKVERHKPVGIIASNIASNAQYLSIAAHCDNILFSNFKPEI